MLATRGVHTQRDPHFANVSLLLHCNGANAGTTFTDKSPSPSTITANGNAQTSTAQWKFGGSSLLLDGSGDYLTVPDAAKLTFNADFTLEAWFRKTSSTDSNHIFVKHSGGGPEYIFGVGANQKVYFLWAPISAGSLAIESATGLYSLNTWNHTAISRNGSAIKMWLNGVQIGSATNGTAGTDGTEPLYIGAYPGLDFVTGNLAEVRVTKGVGRYSTACPIPTAPFPNF